MTETSEATDPGREPVTREEFNEVRGDIGWIKDKLAHLVPGSHAEAEKRTEARLDRGSTVEDQVRAELQRARQEEEAAARADAEKREGESVRERLARLEEKPPAPPRSRKTAALGWGDGRT